MTNDNTHTSINQSMPTTNPTTMTASAALRTGSPQLLSNKNDKTPLLNQSYNYNSVIRQSTNNQLKPSLPSSPGHNHQPQHYPHSNNFNTQDIVTGLTQSNAANSNGGTNYNTIDISRIAHSPALPGGNQLPTLPPLNTASQPSPRLQRINGKWPNNMNEELARSTSNATLISTSSSNPSLLLQQQQQHQQQQQRQQDPSILMQYHDAGDRSRLITSAYTTPQQQHTHTQPNQPDIFGEIGPYGCGVAGCFASFSASNGLFYHMKNSHSNLEQTEKPYRCAVPNCTKRYKNINGLQYHLREAKGSSGHGCIDGDGNSANIKPFQCQVPGCKKAYRTANGLRYHQVHGHNITPHEQVMLSGLQPSATPQHMTLQHTMSPEQSQQQQQQQSLPHFRLQRDRWLLNNNI
ncbi:uncharacterized protein RHIMIDRAFT_135412 [Rhizopus microsporus ATCC 52813]|uniref:C2H2-type domain-containing protein n=3 Tax=Rhizopus microsporus TaxID=58291 RepID=A0A2G4SV90_RHIZD|nr:uncharacterized protein RHIMIDRAFT_135412 [Rhizopus microsporus ATCC 52813]PHZ12664.1 hypothetical protein RHIMIDRAFT_135412 [Rhizopus microsporus ATCC 52813]